VRKSTLILLTAACSATVAVAQQIHNHSHDVSTVAPAEDKRQVVKFPPMVREHTLKSMRDHLLALSEIQDHLSQGHFEIAGKIAENRLGLSSFQLHGAHESSKYMPKGMQEIGGSMHRAASQFAVLAQESEVTRDYAKAIGALSKLTGACVACHAAYKVEH